MKSDQIKNLKVLGASFCLGAVLLTGCGEDRIPVGKSDIILEEGKTTGSISYEDIDNWVKIVSFEQNGEISYRLLAVVSSSYCYYDKSPKNYKRNQYYDLRTGSCVLDYYNYYNQEKIKYEIGKGLNKVGEIDITSYLWSEDFIQKEYTVEELLAFFQEKVLPTLENNNKELVK